MRPVDAGQRPSVSAAKSRLSQDNVGFEHGVSIQSVVLRVSACQHKEVASFGCGVSEALAHRAVAQETQRKEHLIAGCERSALRGCHPYQWIRCENRPAQECLVDSVDYAANNALMNFARPAGSPLATHLTLPFLIMSIASIPRNVRHAVASEP
jgi:hypothetical protein